MRKLALKTITRNRKKLIIILSVFLSVIILGVVVYFGFIKKEPYANMNFTINDTLSDGNNTKVKVILLGGQSNASGASHVLELKNNVSEEKFQEYSDGYKNIYINYYNDNGNNSSNGFVNLKIDQGALKGYFGPELGMGERISQIYPDEVVFIIKYAWSGSNLHEQWNSETGEMYKAFIKFVRENMEYLKIKHYIPEIVAMMWMQGESDAYDSCADNYENHLSKMISKIRKDLNYYISEKGMYFIDAYISHSSYWPRYETINKAKQNVCDSNEFNLCIDTIKEGLTFDKEPAQHVDLAHYDSLSEIKLGWLFIEALKNKLI